MKAWRPRTGGAVLLGLGIFTGVVGLVTTSRLAGIFATVLLLLGGAVIGVDARREFVDPSKPSPLSGIGLSARMSMPGGGRASLAHQAPRSVAPKDEAPDDARVFASRLVAGLDAISDAARAAPTGVEVDALRDRLARLVANPLYGAALERRLFDPESVTKVAALLRDER
jgi:hypothetical protein